MAVLVAVRDLLLRSRICEAAERTGVPVRVARRGVPLSHATAELGGRGTALVDLAEPGILEELRRVKEQRGIRVIGFLGHLQTDLAAAALAAGADEVLSRGQLVARLDGVLRDALLPEAGASAID
jgi:DNA-binding response OmpR family regulator